MNYRHSETNNNPDERILIVEWGKWGKWGSAQRSFKVYRKSDPDNPLGFFNFGSTSVWVVLDDLGTLFDEIRFIEKEL